MFTGIIKELGRVARIDKIGVWRLRITCNETAAGARIGDSVAVNGICLTVVETGKDWLGFDVMAETVRASNIQKLAAGDEVNVEDALKVGDHLGGHIVQGHIDCAGTIIGIERKTGDVAIEIGISAESGHLVVEKGSVAVDGISLTVGAVTPKSFTVHVIPHTLAVTNLESARQGDMVNVEFDIVGKYIARSKELEKGGASVSEELLRRAKFI